jgi:hypothetical protein
MSTTERPDSNSRSHTMNIHPNSAWVFIAVLIAIAETADATQPPDPNPSSDPQGNSAHGTSALANVIPGTQSGNQNTAVGFQALQNDASGFSNTAAGWQALGSDTTGATNTAVGSSALAFNTTGFDNVAVGYGAL